MSVSPADCFRGGSHFKPAAGFEVLAIRRSHCVVGFLSADDTGSVITYQAGECCFALMSPLFAGEGGCWGQTGRAMVAIIGFSPASHDPFYLVYTWTCGALSS